MVKNACIFRKFGNAKKFYLSQLFDQKIYIFRLINNKNLLQNYQIIGKCPIYKQNFNGHTYHPTLSSIRGKISIKLYIINQMLNISSKLLEQYVGLCKAYWRIHQYVHTYVNVCTYIPVFTPVQTTIFFTHIFLSRSIYAIYTYINVAYKFLYTLLHNPTSTQQKDTLADFKNVSKKPALPRQQLCKMTYIQLSIIQSLWDLKIFKTKFELLNNSNY
eukprot:TRINITY_DN19944_c0_g1_i1.p1 TRINITY_DN19944_c0_g1~~TRINITY_DN19944_c0_g1_i1.p1  ORF type:complete len:217 (+),score=-24.84 TRINITY_DN19944_c0_g1_i1:57-707(+)